MSYGVVFNKEEFSQRAQRYKDHKGELRIVVYGLSVSFTTR